MANTGSLASGVASPAFVLARAFSAVTEFASLLMSVPAPRVPRDRESTRHPPELSQFVILMIPAIPLAML